MKLTPEMRARAIAVMTELGYAVKHLTGFEDDLLIAGYRLGVEDAAKVCESRATIPFTHLRNKPERTKEQG